MRDKPFLAKILPFLKARYAPRGARISFSGSGEDIIMSDILKKLGVKKALYVDIGAHHPIFGSNTYLLYRNGGRGVLVEPNAELCRLAERMRPRDIVVNAGAGRTDGKADFYSFPQNTRNTFSREDAEAWEKISGQKFEIQSRRIWSLDSIIEKFCDSRIPDMISMDAEGLDYEILSGFNWMRRPKLFCVETVASSGGRDSENIEILMKSKGYKIVAKTPINSIFSDQ